MAARRNVQRRYTSLSPKAFALRVHRLPLYQHVKGSLENSSLTRELSGLPLRSGSSCGPSCRRTCRVS